ncbi:MAG TPA: ASCH domain-containing protein [archaeon]|nr:ASCH domain-containing protein [archaeon]
MKQLGFIEELIPLVISGEKTITWRVNDDKNLSVNDLVECVESKTRKQFCRIKLLSIRNTTFGQLTDDDWKGHEKFASSEAMYKQYSKNYGFKITPETPLKVINFRLI